MSEPAAEHSIPHSQPAEEPLIPISDADLATLTTARTTPGPYTLGHDSIAQEGVPRGVVSQHHWTSAAIYPGVERDYKKSAESPPLYANLARANVRLEQKRISYAYAVRRIQEFVVAC